MRKPVPARTHVVPIGVIVVLIPVVVHLVVVVLMVVMVVVVVVVVVMVVVVVVVFVVALVAILITVLVGEREVGVLHAGPVTAARTIRSSRSGGGPRRRRPAGRGAGSRRAAHLGAWRGRGTTGSDAHGCARGATRPQPPQEQSSANMGGEQHQRRAHALGSSPLFHTHTCTQIHSQPHPAHESAALTRKHAQKSQPPRTPPPTVARDNPRPRPAPHTHTQASP